jgi:hypothetical protein
MIPVKSELIDWFIDLVSKGTQFFQMDGNQSPKKQTEAGRQKFR